MTKLEYIQLAKDLCYHYAVPGIFSKIRNAKDEAAIQRILIDARHASSARERSFRA